MIGLYGLYDQNNILKLDIKKVDSFFNARKDQNYIDDIFIDGYHTVGRKIIKRTAKEKVFFINKQYVINFDGYIFDKHCNAQDYVINKINDIDFSKIEYNGSYVSSILDRKSGEVTLSTDHIGSKKMFYYLNKDLAIFVYSSSFDFIVNLLKDNDINLSLSYDGVYSMVSSGFMLGDLTYAKEIKKLGQGEHLFFCPDSHSIEIQKYFKIKKNPCNNITKEQILEKYQFLLVQAVDRQFKISSKIHKNDSLTCLSGGLDSRLTTLIATKLGYKCKAFTFSESDTPDHLISLKIAKDNDLDHYFYSLDNGTYLEFSLFEYVRLNSGMVSLAGASHLYNSVNNKNLKEYCILHTGGVGDLIFGSYTKDFSINSVVYNNISQIKSKVISNILSSYKDAEMYALEQKVNCSALNGDIVVSELMDSLSPFTDKELVEFTLQIPDKYKVDQKIYIEMIRKYFPYASMYKWEKTGWYPRYYYLNKILGKIKWLVNGLKNRAGILKKDMNPFAYWFSKNKNILINMDCIFNHNIECIDDYELKRILTGQYKKRPRDKMIVITILLSINRYLFKQ
jgi:asparagine synthase (glutamine-hydrolysing)